MRNKYLLLASAAMIAGLSSCKTPAPVAANTAGVVKTETASQTEGVISKVLYGSWTAAQVGKQAVDGTDRPYVEFGQDAANPFLVKCYAYDGCNYLNGVYAVTPGGQMKRTSDFISTMRMCPDAKYEMVFNLALNNVAGYKIEKAGLDYLLYLQNESGETMMTLRKFESRFINGAWKVTAINGTSVDSDIDLQLVIDMTERSIHGNVGCNTLNGTITVDPNRQNSLQFTNMATTRMTCPYITTEQALVNALSTVVDVMPGGSDNAAVLRNAEGNDVINLQRINLK